MSDDELDKADRRFEAALAETGARDPRDFYRQLLRGLREQSEERYRDAVTRWRDEVVLPLARDEGDPLELWLRFGASVASELHPGRPVVVDESGRAAPYEPPPSWRDLILHLPDEKRVKAVPVSLPPELSPAQQATVDLLVKGKNRLPE
jgi:hypothetical protein